VLRDESPAQSYDLIRHQEYKWPYVFFRGPIPIAEQDFVDHQARLAFAKQQISDRLRHQITTCKPDEYRDGVNDFAQVGNRVRDRNRTVDLCHVVVSLLGDGQLKRRGENAAVVEKVDMQKQEGALHAVMLGDQGALFVALVR